MNRLLMILLILFGMMSAFAVDTINGSYSYNYGDSESLVEARQTCKDLALRDGIESYYIFIESSTEVENFQLKEDIVQTIAAGYIKNLQIVEQTEEGRTINTTIQAEVDPEEVKNLVAEIALRKNESDQGSVEDPDEQFNAAFAEYQRRLKEAETLQKKEEFDGSIASYQNTETFLEGLKPNSSNPFQWNVYQAARSRSLVQRKLVRIMRLEKFRRNKRAKAKTKEMVQDAVELKNHFLALEKMKNLTQQQENIRKRVASYCRNTLLRAKETAKRILQ